VGGSKTKRGRPMRQKEGKGKDNNRETSPLNVARGGGTKSY